MKGKKTFIRAEAERIKLLINRKVKASKYDQKRIRDEIRATGFYFSDFSSKKGCTVADFDNLIRIRQIEIIDSVDSQVIEPSTNVLSFNDLASLNYNQTVPKERVPSVAVDISEVELKLLKEGKYLSAKIIDSKLPKDNPGFYSIRLTENSILPEKYQHILAKRSHGIIYIGKAEGQPLFDRLQQELRAAGPGTFFRSIGAVLGFLPPFGSLINKKNQNNYKFSKEDKAKIIDWINSNLEISWIKYCGDFSIEQKLIKKYCPLLNDTHNPLALSELREDKDKCRTVARGN